MTKHNQIVFILQLHKLSFIRSQKIWCNLGPFNKGGKCSDIIFSFKNYSKSIYRVITSEGNSAARITINIFLKTGLQYIYHNIDNNVINLVLK